MSILVNNDTRLAVAGITGREGSFHTLNNRAYGTNVVGGINPKKAGENVEGIPVFANWADTVAETQANTAMIFVPPPFAAASALEAAQAGVELVVIITEGIPAHDELKLYNQVKRDHPNTRIVGPNCPGILSPGEAAMLRIPSDASPRPWLVSIAGARSVEVCAVRKFAGVCLASTEFTRFA